MIGGAMAAVLVPSRLAMADGERTPNDPFIFLLHGFCQPVPIGQGPSCFVKKTLACFGSRLCNLAPKSSWVMG